MPVLNEAPALAERLRALQRLRRHDCELIVVDGGSDDASAAIAKPLADKVLSSASGRARQMNAGARAASGEILWFLHADVTPPAGAESLIRRALSSGGAVWGRFDVRLSGAGAPLRLVETAMNLRSRWTGIATGDQGIFVRREFFFQAGAYPDIALMEDIALSSTLRSLARPVCLRTKLSVSSRRWESRGVLGTMLLMWRLRLQYFFGADPTRLARLYYRDHPG